MDSLIYSIDATFPIFLMILMGIFLKKIHLIDDSFVKVANKLVFTVTLPVMVFEDLAYEDFRHNFEGKFVLYCFIATLLSIIIIWILTDIFVKEKESQGSFIQGCYRSSAAILGMAFIKNVYADAGMAPLMIIGAVPLYNVFAVAVLTAKARSAKHFDLKKTLIGIAKNPIIIGIVLGIISSLIGIDYPVIVDKTLSMTGGLTTPLALICIGAAFELGEARLKLKLASVATVVKLVILPAIILPIAVILGFRNQELMALVIMSGSPTTVSAYIMSRNMDNDHVLSSDIILMTTALSCFTLTAIIWILRSKGLL